MVPCALVTLLAAGCATTEQVREVEKSGFLGDYSELQPGGEGQVALRYINPRAQFSRYSKVLIDPVTLWVSEGSSVSGVPVEDRKMLVDYVHTALSDSLGKDYALVGEPGPGVMRLRVAITEAQQAPVVMSTVSNVVPQMLVLSNLKKMVTGTQAFVGGAAVEGELLDATTGERLAAFVDRRSGGKSIERIGAGSWNDFKNACQVWADLLAKRLAEFRAQ
jgi:hypothetical protein